MEFIKDKWFEIIKNTFDLEIDAIDNDVQSIEDLKKSYPFLYGFYKLLSIKQDFDGHDYQTEFLIDFGLIDDGEV